MAEKIDFFESSHGKNNASDLYDGNGETVVYLEDAFFHGKRAANQSMIMGAQMREAARAPHAPALRTIYMRRLKCLPFCYPLSLP